MEQCGAILFQVGRMLNLLICRSSSVGLLIPDRGRYIESAKKYYFSVNEACHHHLIVYVVKQLEAEW